MTGKAHFRRLAVAALLAGGIVAAWRWRGLFDPLALTGLIGGNPMAPHRCTRQSDPPTL